MKVKFNKFERVAGVFVLAAIGSGVIVLAMIAVKQGWFESKVRYKTTLTNADGVRVGTAVQMAGLRAGSVVEVDLRGNNVVHVVFEVSQKYHELVREDSVVRMVRPFVISEKVVDVSVGDAQAPSAKPDSELKSEPTTDIMDLVSGKSMAAQLGAITKMMENLRMVGEAILSPERAKDMVAIFDEMRPMVHNLAGITKQIAEVMKESNRDKKLVRMVGDLSNITSELNKMLPLVNQVLPGMLKDSPQLAADLAKISANLAVMTDEVSAALPQVKKTMADIGPEVPRATRRAMEALDETVVTLKALQKSFILQGKVNDVRAEEAEREKSRAPANKGDVK